MAVTYIIAEAGTAYLAGDTVEEQLTICHHAFGAAESAGADAVKFQMFVPDEPLFCPIPGDEKRFERWNRSRMTLQAWTELQDRLALAAGADLLWSVFQPTCIEWLKELKPRYVKVASRACYKYDYGTVPEGSDVIQSMPNSWLEPIDNSNSRPKLYTLKCITQYPCPLKGAGWVEPCDGLSDHSGTIWPGLDAIYHQAKFLEVHVKLPGCDMGNDEPVCLTMEQLKLLCDARDAVAIMHPHTV